MFAKDVVKVGKIEGKDELGGKNMLIVYGGLLCYYSI